MKSRRLNIECLETRLALAGVQCLTHPPPSQGETSNAVSVHVADMDRDSAGDANRDVQFNQFHIAQVLLAAKYLTGQPATWAEGDWNGDGVFDQMDLIAAMQEGNYVSKLFAADGPPRQSHWTGAVRAMYRILTRHWTPAAVQVPHSHPAGQR